MVVKIWKDVRGNQGKFMSADKFGRYTTEVEERVVRRERLALRNELKSAKHLKIYGGLSEGDLDLPERRGIPVAGKRRK